MATSFDSTLSNLGIKRYGTSATGEPTVASSGKGLEQMGQSDFIALLTAQMKNQDPFEPVDNSQMVAQMAQFSSLAGISEMSSTLKAISEKLGAVSGTNALSYVGRTVLTEGSVAYPRTAGGFAGAIELDADASDVTVTIANANGEVMKSVNLGKQAKGTVNFDWDGTTQSGEPAGDGPFKVTVNAKNAGTTVVARSLVWAPVASVSMPAGGEPVLSVLGVGDVKSSAVRQIA